MNEYYNYVENVEVCSYCGNKNIELIEKKNFTNINDYASKSALIEMNLENYEFGFYKCKNCGLEFMSPRWTDEGIEKFYYYWYKFQGPSSYTEKNYHERNRQIIQYLNKLNSNINNVLDIGCGKGHFLESCRKVLGDNIELYGIELDSNASQIAKQRGFKIFNKDIMELEINKKYDLIVMNSVLEHLREPFKVLQQVRKHLKKNGILYFNVPNVNSLSHKIYKILKLSNPNYIIEHLYYFHPNNFKDADIIIEKPIYKQKYNISFNPKWFIINTMEYLSGFNQMVVIYKGK
jgi:2-polyprenyl-3-methyl-5-hydroxy-6-metoxy-1,4-benzoquinol methylase